MKDTSDTQQLVELPVEEAAEQFEKSRRGEVRDKTIRSQMTGVNWFVEWCQENEKSLDQLNGMDLQKFYNHLKDEGFEIVTLRQYMTAVRQFLLYLERVEVAPPGIADKVHRPVIEKKDRKRDQEIDPERVKQILDWMEKYRYASRDHVIMILLWHCGLRNGSVHSLDIEDLNELDGSGPVLELHHRPETETPLKNGYDAERPINLDPDAAEAIQDYVEHNRIQVEDSHGRKPLLTSTNGRLSTHAIRKTCHLYTCPRTTAIGDCGCEEDRTREDAKHCDRSVPPHTIRSASITYWRRKDIPVDVVSDRMDVSRDVIEQHYDRRTEEGKARQRRKYLDSL